MNPRVTLVWDTPQKHYFETLKKVFYFQIFAWRGPRIMIQGRFESEEIPSPLSVIPNDAIRVQVAVSGVTRGIVAGLEPWTQYNVAVQGYNNAGLGAPSDETLSVTTLDSSKLGANRW